MLIESRILSLFLRNAAPITPPQSPPARRGSSRLKRLIQVALQVVDFIPYPSRRGLGDGE